MKLCNLRCPRDDIRVACEKEEGHNGRHAVTLYWEDEK